MSSTSPGVIRYRPFDENMTGPAPLSGPIGTTGDTADAVPDDDGASERCADSVDTALADTSSTMTLAMKSDDRMAFDVCAHRG